LDEDLIDTIKAEMPVMPAEWRKRLANLGLDASQTATLLEGDVEDTSVSYLALIEESIGDKEFAKTLANWFVNLEIPLRSDEAAALNAKLTNQGRLQLYRTTYDLIKTNKLSSTNAKALLTKVLTADDQITDVEGYAKQHNLIQESDEGQLAKAVATILAENPKAAEDIKNGELKAIGFLVGQVMKHTQGRANPGLVQQIIKNQLHID
jgi:aspartyl-tRNA(Asn)/glutamyl-tRNA(Gln) amidotransferase subunit B